MRKFILMTALAGLAIPAASASAARTMIGYTVRSTNMRAGPDYDYPRVRRISRNAQVSIHGCLRDWSWCDVAYRYDRGWVAGRDLVANYQGRRRGVSSYLGIGVLTFVFGNYWESYYRNRPFYGERTRWERHYYDNYQPHWGPRPSPPPTYQQPRRRPAPQGQPVVPRREQKAVPAPRPQPQTNPGMAQHPATTTPPGQVDRARRKPTPQLVPAPQPGDEKRKLRSEHPEHPDKPQ